MNLEDIGLTNDDLIERVVQKIVDTLGDEYEFFSDLKQTVKTKVYERIGESMNRKVDAALDDAMGAILAEKICPVTIWGEQAGEETTLRDALAKQARTFWETNVDKDGKLTKSYGGKPRHQHLMEQLLKDEFSQAVREHATVIVDGFKAAVKGDLQSMVNAHIEKLIPSRR